MLPIAFWCVEDEIERVGDKEERVENKVEISILGEKSSKWLQ